jgi:hypothetical protein
VRIVAGMSSNGFTKLGALLDGKSTYERWVEEQGVTKS